MQTRAVRLSLLALLLITGLGAGLFMWDTRQQLDVLLTDERDVDARFDRLARNVAAFGAAQQAAVVPGHGQGDALARGSTLIKQIDEDVAALRPRSRSTAAGTTFSTFADALESAVKTDTRVREHLRLEQELMAADVAVEGRASIDALVALVGELQMAERTAIDEERRRLETRSAMVLSGVVVLWVIGVFALARTPRMAEEAARPEGEAVYRAVDPRHPVAPNVQARAAPAPVVPPSVDIAEAAAACTALSRVSRASELPDILARVARTLDCSGLIVWLGAGEELFAATAHGYHPRMLARLGPIRRDADNATAAAWRACELRVVPGDATANGAIVAPLFSPEDCIGVLAAEFRGAREQDATVRAVTSMVAAQLATIVAAWPAPSSVEGPSRSSQDPTSEAADHGHTAATA